jgi:uncharacterized repeat protein (TIGR01451 family)
VRKAISVGVVLAFAVMAMALAGATSAAGPGPARLGTHAVGPAFVKQLGKRNYAGPNCPGVSWNCTTSTRVFQAAAPGGQNVAECVGPGAVSGGTLANPTCVITQTGSSNVAKCTQKSGDPSSSQSCVIDQSGASNTATVSQYINQGTTAIQTGTQTASVTQNGATVSNIVKLTQSVSQVIKSSGTQTQDAFQTALVAQTAAGGGSSLSDVNQSQLQKEYGGNIQSQNTAGSTCNECVNVAQHSAAGTNTSKIGQSINEDINSSVVATQTQGTGANGIDGHVHQDSQSGTSFNDVNQSKNQTVNGPAGSTQVQHDPISCCGFASQFGGSGNVENINQSSALKASNAAAIQSSAMFGTSKSPFGTCNIKQNAALDAASKTNSASLFPCPELSLETRCSGGTEVVGRGGDACTSAESTLSKAVRNVTTEDQTFGTTTTASPGDTVEYRIIYGNTGKGAAQNVVVSDLVPTEMSFVAGSCTPSCTFSDGVVSWNLGTVEAAGTRELFFRASITATEFTSIDNLATGLADADAATSNVASVTPQVVESTLTTEVRNLGAEGDNFAAEWGTTTNALSGDVLEYRIVYANDGTGPAHDAWVSTARPADTTPVDAIPVPGPGETTILTGYVCPQSITLDGKCFLGFPEGTVEPDAVDSLRTVLFSVEVTATCPDGGPITYSASGHTDEEGTIGSNSTTVNLVCLT